MKHLLILLALIALLLLTFQAVHAAGGYTMEWWTVDSGGTLKGGSYSLSGTVGQAEAGSLSGGDYSLAGGFWASLQAAMEKIFLPLVLKH